MKKNSSQIPYHKGIILLMGNVGTGKTSFAKKYVRDKKPENIHHWEMDSYGLKIKHYSDEQQFEVVEQDIKGRFTITGTLVVDGTFQSRKSRKLILNASRNLGIKVLVVNFGSGDTESLQRRIDASPQISKERWQKSHDKTQMEFEKPTLDEGIVGVYELNNDRFIRVC